MRPSHEAARNTHLKFTGMDPAVATNKTTSSAGADGCVSPQPLGQSLSLSQDPMSGQVADKALDQDRSPTFPGPVPPSRSCSEHAQDIRAKAPLEPSKKRRIDTAPDPLPAKRRRQESPDAQRPTGKGKNEQTPEATLVQPKPAPPISQNAPFLRDLVEPVESPQSVFASVSSWLDSVGPGRARRCQSEGHRSEKGRDDPILTRNIPKSAPPEMGRTRGSDGFVLPPTPGSDGSSMPSRGTRADTDDDRSRASTTSSNGGVRHPLYRENNLQLNHIHFRLADAPLPDNITAHLDVLRAQRDSPELSSTELDQMMHRVHVLGNGCVESQVEAFLNHSIFPDPATGTDPTYGPATGLMSTSGTLMSQHLVPADPASPFKVSQPKPDKLYGYSGMVATRFTQPQLLAQTMVYPRGPDFAAATMQGLRFPFFAVEFKAACGTNGNIWVAANQCAGASAACVNAVEKLHVLLRECADDLDSVKLVDHLSYSVAVDNNVAKLYISWKEDNLDFYIQQVGVFLLSSPDHFKDLRRQVRNILDWGKDTRLKEIMGALDIILEENRKKAAEYAKSRPPPSNGSVSSSGKKQKS